jgi:membrane protease subunit (stomatin/prohibitin family)
MGIMDFIKGELLEIIEWTDDSRDTLSWRFPDEDKAIKNGAQLIVRESQVAQFVYVGEFGDTFKPGKHTLTTDNIPVLTKIKSWPFGFNSPFKADVYFVVTRLFTGNKWGTSNPVMLRDSDFGMVRVRAFGTYDFKIVDPKTFLREVAGSDHNFRLDEFADTMRSRIVSIFTDAIATAKIPVLDVASRYTELGEALQPLINPAIVAKYGLEITSFIVENVSVPPEVEQAIDKRASMAAVGNLNDFVKYQMGKGLETGAGGGGAAGTAAELAVGFGLAQQMLRDGFMSGHAAPTVVPPLPTAAAAGGWIARVAQPGGRGAGVGRVGSRRDDRARVRRSERQEDRLVVEDLARGVEVVHVVGDVLLQSPRSRSMSARPAVRRPNGIRQAEADLSVLRNGVAVPHRSRARQSRRARSREGAARAARRGAWVADRAAQRAVSVV